MHYFFTHVISICVRVILQYYLSLCKYNHVLRENKIDIHGLCCFILLVMHLVILLLLFYDSYSEVHYCDYSARRLLHLLFLTTQWRLEKVYNNKRKETFSVYDMKSSLSLEERFVFRI